MEHASIYTLILFIPVLIVLKNFCAGKKIKSELMELLTDHVLQPLQGQLSFYAAKFYEKCLYKVG